MKKILFLILIIHITLLADENKIFSKVFKNINNEYNYICNHPEPISKEKQKLVIEANELFEDTATVVSRLTRQKYIVEASALNASIVLAKMNRFIPVKFRDDLGRVGFMKNKPIIATVKKLLEFMKETHDGEIIKVNNPKNYKNLCDKMCGKKGLYIMRTKDNIGYKLTGYAIPWDDNKTLNGKTYLKYSTEAWLFVDKKKVLNKNNNSNKPQVLKAN